jgi:hypothetical protein
MPVAAVALAVAVLVSQPNVAKLVLKPSSVARGYVMVLPPDGKGTSHRTLDLCGTKNYPSEALRTARLQVNYGKPNAKLLLSNEVVVYKDGGAAQAMREVARHAKNCPATFPVAGGQPPIRYQITRIADAKLLRGAIALRIDVSGTVSGRRVHRIDFVVYQRLGSVLSGVYSYAAGSVSAAAQKRFALHAAEASAEILRHGGQRGSLPA